MIDANHLYLPLHAEKFATIEDRFATKQADFAAMLIGKSVYILRGKTRAIPIFCGLVLVESVEQSADNLTCVYLRGNILIESGEAPEDTPVRIAISEHTLVRYRNR